MSKAISHRYARALADVVGRTGDYSTALRELEEFAAVYRANAELRDVFRTPAVTPADKSGILETILARAGTSRTVGNFLRILLKNYRLVLIDDIVEAFKEAAHERMGVVEVQISSAVDLSEAERQALRTRFESITGKQVDVEFQIAKELLGGVVAQIGSTIYDGSVRGHLARIRERLVAR
ncbi:MAG: ATP synthase F1 subunit delta [Terriglobia bacterium]